MGAHSPGLSVISVWIELGSDPITGAISYGGASESSFHGWLELLVSLEAVHRGEGPELTSEDDKGLGENPGADRDGRAVLPPVRRERSDPRVGDGRAAE